VSVDLPRWAAEMRDLFRSGSAAQFLLHGNVFDVVPSAGKLLSVPSFLEQMMFATYDVVLRYDRSRGVRATRGADDWGDWLQGALGKEASTLSLTREPGAALELIDRYLLRTLNLQGLPGATAPRRIAVIIEFAEFVVPVRRQHGEGPRLGQRPRDRPLEHRDHADQRRPARSQRAGRRESACRVAPPAAAG
jgi:hypothetical protein